MKFKRTWITGIPCNKMIRSGILALPCPCRRMMSLDILLLMLTGLACLLWSPAGLAMKTFNLLLRETPTIFLRNYLFILYSSGPRPITSAVYWIISCVRCAGSSGLPTELLPFGDSDCLYGFVHYTRLGMGSQSLELRGWTTTKFCNWIRRSSWKFRHFHVINN